MFRAILCVATLLCVTASRLSASSGSVTLTHELKLDEQRMRAGALPVTASWSTPIKNGRLTLLGDTGRGKGSFAREVRLSGVVSKTTVLGEAATVSYDVSRRFRSGQTAYKVTAESRGMALVASTPFVEGGPRSWLCDAPALTEASASLPSAWCGWGVTAAALLKGRALRLGLSHKVGKRGAFRSNFVLHGGSGVAAGERLEAELVYRASLAEGRALTATLTPALQRPRAPDYDGASLGQLELAYTDAALEPRALWTARASATLGDGAPRPKLAIVRRCSL